MTHFATVDTPVTVKLTDYLERKYGAPFTIRRKSPHGPGYAVYANTLGGEYGGRLVMECLKPDVPYRKHVYYTCRVQYGYRTIAEAKAACLRHLGAAAVLRIRR